VPQLTEKSLHFSLNVLKSLPTLQRSLNSTKNVLKKPCNFLKTRTLIKKSLNFSGNVFKKNRNIKKKALRQLLHCHNGQSAISK
jgi:hypothetical protein